MTDEGGARLSTVATVPAMTVVTSKGWGMTAEIRDDTGSAGLGRGTGFGRGGGLDSLAARREAAQRRLSSSVRATELVDCALRSFDEAVAERGVADPDGSLRPTVRALLTLAYGAVGYDVTILPAASDAAVRVRYTPFGPEAEVVALVPVAEQTVSGPPPGAAPLAPVAAAPPARFADDDVPRQEETDGNPRGTAPAASPWWTP